MRNVYGKMKDLVNKEVFHEDTLVKYYSWYELAVTGCTAALFYYTLNRCR
jgi:hypothetical protein